MPYDRFSNRDVPELSPEEREMRDPKTLLLLTVNKKGDVEGRKPWNKKVVPLHSKFQLLKENRTGQFALIAWPKAEFESEKVRDAYTEFRQPEGYRTSYEHFEEIGLYSSVKEATERMESVDADFDPLVEMQENIDTTFRQDQKKPLNNEKEMSV